jgi:hypothetical protein
MVYNIHVFTSQKSRVAGLLASVVACVAAVTGCSANPGPPHVVSDTEIAQAALKNGGYTNVTPIDKDTAQGVYGNCLMLATFAPTSENPVLVVGELRQQSSGDVISFNNQYLPNTRALAQNELATKICR